MKRLTEIYTENLSENILEKQQFHAYCLNITIILGLSKTVTHIFFQHILFVF